MFERKGSAFIISTVYPDFTTCRNDWAGLKRQASVFEKSFEYDPDTFLYYRARAITADAPNSNGDYFPYKEIEAAYQSFIGKGVYYNHDNDCPDKAFGVILDAELLPNHKYVEILCALDKELANQKQPGLLRKIQSGFVNSTSMSCLAREAVCGLCGNKARDMETLCAHMNPESLHYIKGKRASSGQLAYEINYGLTFTEDSIVDNPADHTAHIFEVFAKAKNTSNIEELREHVAKLQGLVEDFARSMGVTR